MVVFSRYSSFKRQAVSAFCRPRAFWLAAVFLAATSAFSFAQAQVNVPLGIGWSAHRQLQVRNVNADAPGDPIAVAEFYTNGQQLPDGSDIRVTTADRRIVPMRVLEVSKESDFVRVAFLCRDSGTYHVWWGNNNPGAAPPDVDVKRGVLAEVFRFPGGAVDNESQMDRAFVRAGSPVASLIVPEIFLGYNPIGESWSPMIRYSGQFRVDRAGEYDIAMAVDDSGYVRIDGKTILCLSNVWLEGRGRWSKKINLTAGWHQIDAAQIDNRGGETGITIGWKPAGVPRYSTIPAAAYSPAANAQAGPLEVQGKNYSADFTIEPSGECFTAPDFYLPRYTLEVVFPPQLNAKVQWDFGDGQIATGNKISHVFLTPGVYPVKLTLHALGGSFVTTQRIAVKDRLYQRFPIPPEDLPRATAQILLTYDPKTLNVQQLWRGLQLFDSLKMDEGTSAWGRAWLENPAPQNDWLVWREVQDLAQAYRAKKKYRLAAEAFILAAGKKISVETRATAIRHAVLSLCDEVNQPAEALKLARDYRDKLSGNNREVQRTLSLAIAYAAIANGDGKMAAKAIEDLGPRRDMGYNEQEIQQGVMTRNIETYTRAHDFETADNLIDQWERDYPHALITGFTRLMAVKLLLEQKQFAAAARLAEQHARALPDTFYAAELLYHARNAYTAAGDAQAASRCADLLTSKYPESPYARKKAPDPE